MSGVLHLVWVCAAVVLVVCTLPLVLELLVLSAASLLPGRRILPLNAGRLRLAVVVPAHNEEGGITRCVASLVASARAPDAVYVVAHNCSDATAARAEAAGATALPLHDDGTRGKGAALLFGLVQATDAGHEAVLVVDADSTADAGLTGEAEAAFLRGAAGVQARYVASNAEATTRTRLMALSLTGMNVVRPLGRSRLGMSSGIFGNGFGLSAATLRAIPYTAHSVVEDLEYHLALVTSGRSVEFLDGATVRGELPDNDRAATTQRARWEGGRARMRREFAPRLLREVVRGRVRLLEPLLDLLSVPIGTAVPLLVVLLVLPVGWGRWYAVTGLAALVLYVGAALRLSADPAGAVRALLSVPGYLAFKLGLFGAKRRAARGEAAWVRTARNEEGGEGR